MIFIEIATGRLFVMYIKSLSEESYELDDGSECKVIGVIGMAGEYELICTMPNYIEFYKIFEFVGFL